MLKYENLFSQLVSELGFWVTIKDHTGILSHPDGRIFFEHRRLHRNPWCTQGRVEGSDWGKLCRQTCNVDRFNLVLESKTTIVSLPCYKGLVECHIPILKDGQIQFIFYVGIFRASEPLESTKKYWKNVQHGGGVDLQSLSVFLPLRKQFMSSLFEIIGAGILNEIHQNSYQANTRANTILRYIDEHYHEKCEIKGLAERLFLSPSRTRRVIQEEMGKGFSELLLQERMRRAKSLMLNTALNLADIAERIGMANGFNLSKQFKKYFGMSPKDYRKSI